MPGKEILYCKSELIYEEENMKKKRYLGNIIGERPMLCLDPMLWLNTVPLEVLLLIQALEKILYIKLQAKHHHNSVTIRKHLFY